MQRQHPFLSPTGITLTVIMFILLALVYWQTGGRMFSPGQLTAKSLPGFMLNSVASHAEIQQCSLCHQPLETTQAKLCMDCHTNIQEQLDTNDGVHAELEGVETCFACHSDHRGRDFDPTLEARKNFDHTIAPFSLTHHQFDYDASPIDCQDCHLPNIPSSEFDEQSCTDCHTLEDAVFMTEHEVTFGSACLECHDGFDRMVGFDHETTEFPLIGEHMNAGCADCHTNPEFETTSSQCSDCHEEPSLHAGLFPTTCETCHTPDGWHPALLEGVDFDHFVQTGFSLERHIQDYAGTPITCSACHESDFRTPVFDLQLCVQCHTLEDPVFMNDHQATFGAACLDCHDGVDRMHDFDHAAFFVLDGAHAEAQCTACHVDQQFTGTPSQCADCHEEPAIHAGIFGLNCQACHSTTAWVPASLISHTFPLDHGGEGIIECLTCHPATYTQYTCDVCHEPAEMVEEHADEDIFNIAGRCTECHATGLKEEGSFGDD